MGLNFTDKDQNSISLMNVSYYDSKAEYIRLTFHGVKTDEEAAEVVAGLPSYALPLGEEVEEIPQGLSDKDIWKYIEYYAD